MATFHLTGDALWARMDRAVENVRRRLERAAGTLGRAGIPYAVSGGNAVRAWVTQADEAAVRTTRDVDILLRRADLPAAVAALESEGFVHRHSAGIDMFLDGPDAKARDAVHVAFSREKVRDGDLVPAPDVDEFEYSNEFRFLKLEALARMELSTFRRKERMHLRDMIDVELIDASWRDRFPPEFAARLQELLDNPDG
ncbi:MAG: nucleotidyltransferase family protein [Planctomycetes bacterium]|nr:nucleotidyltransferase family protein [Planctomycetota bacterium]